MHFDRQLWAMTAGQRGRIALSTLLGLLALASRQVEPAQAGLEPLQAIQSNLNCERYLQRLLERLDGQREDD